MSGERLGETDYEAFLDEGEADHAWSPPADEWQAISLNYTSGTTGDPKGVVYHHRGAYLTAASNAMAWDLGHFPVYLWTLPMFHCNGWCFPWTLAAVAGASVCLRRVSAATIFAAIERHSVSHFCERRMSLKLRTALRASYSVADWSWTAFPSNWLTRWVIYGGKQFWSGPTTTACNALSAALCSNVRRKNEGNCHWPQHWRCWFVE